MYLHKHSGCLNYLTAWFLCIDQQIAPPGTEPFEPKPAEPQKTSPTPPEPTRTVLAPKRSYDAMEGQQHQRYPHSYGPPQAKKPFDYSRVGGKLLSYWRYLGENEAI